MASWELPEGLWRMMAPLVPPDRAHPKGGRPFVPARRAMAAIWYVMRTGCPWRALNATKLCSAATAERRFRLWREAGVFERLHAKCLEQAQAARQVDWSFLAVDGRHTPAPLSRTGKGASWLDRARQGSLWSIIVARQGAVLAIGLSAGQPA